MARFFAVTFHNELLFMQARFYGESDFSGSHFLSKALFPNVVFFSNTKFFKVEFHAIGEFFETIFTMEADFSSTIFMKDANFPSTHFLNNTKFTKARFYAVADFSCEFSSKHVTQFNDVMFENGNMIRFDVKDMSQYSFLDTDITKIRFSDKIRWGGKDNFQVVEETWLKADLATNHTPRVTLVGVLSVYRNLRENYELRRRYDDAGRFFYKEMELKRCYRLVSIPSTAKITLRNIKNRLLGRNSETVQQNLVLLANDPLRRILSLIGLYYLISKYGEDLLRPTLFGITIILISTTFFASQSDPFLVPELP